MNQTATEISSSDQARSQILDAAEHCVRRFGIKRTSMGTVASESQVSRATLYNYFKDKQHLIDALLTRTQQRFCDAAEAHMSPLDTLKEKVVEAVLWSREQINSDLFLNISETEPETAAAMALGGEHFQLCMTFWPGYVQEAIDKKEVRADLDVEQTASWIQRQVLSIVIFPQPSNPSDTKQQTRETVENFLFRGLAT
jgi:AcrR family transcriptional regulator